MRHVTVSLLLTSLLLWSPSDCWAQWPQFRGPDGQGHSNEKRVPLKWSETESIAWKTAVPGSGWSSPVIASGQIWLTSAHDGGKSLHAVCLDQKSGKLLFDVEVLTTDNVGPKHVQNGYASPTPVLDGRRAYVHFGPRGTVCLSLKGEILWKNTELPFELPQGAASSPILHENKLILVCDGTDAQFVTALDKLTGKLIWKTPRQHLERVKDRGFSKMSYATPLIVEVNGVTQIISSGSEHVAAYDVETGKEIWWHQYVGFSIVSRPSHGNGLFYVVGSVSQDHHCIYAIKPGAKGEVKEEDLAWKNPDGIGHVPSPLLYGKEIYVVDDEGTAQCLDAITGTPLWKKRLGGRFRCSPLQISDHILFVSQDGKATMIEAGREFKVIATNQLEGLFLASPAVAQGALFLRSDSHLYRIENRNGG
jgi:outer membrane protein assembly factor BamB